MNELYSLINSIFVLLLLILSVQYLKKRNILQQSQSKQFSALILDYALPAMIFLNLATESIDKDQLLYAGMIFSSDVVCMILSWIIGTLFKFERAKKGAFILLATYGSSTMLGYPIIEQVYPKNAEAMTDAILFSELGVGLSIFTIGIGIALYYSGSKAKGNIRRSFAGFLRSPVFISLILGILISLIGLDLDDDLLKPVDQSLEVIGGSLEIFVAITIGLIFKRFRLKDYIAVFLLVIIVKLLSKPFIALGLFGLIGSDELAKEIIFIQTAMPSATLAVVFSSKYGLDEELAANVMLGVLAVSIITVPLLFYFIL